MKFSHTFTAAFLAATSAAFAGAKAPIPVAKVQHPEPINFEKEILPFLSDNCYACHCQTTTKGGLNLESRELMLKGGDNGAALEPGKGSESLMLQAAAHQDDDLVMPPRDNKAKAKDLTPEQLGLLKLWIDQGAKIPPKAERVVNWQPLSQSLRAIFAVAVTPDGQFAACTRENRVTVYHLPTGRIVMDEAAHRDQVNALAFNPDGTLMASGAYREVKLWRREKNVKTLSLTDAGPRAAVSADGKWLAAARDDGSVKLYSLPDGKFARTLQFPLSLEAKAAPEVRGQACGSSSLLAADASQAAGLTPVKATPILSVKFSPDGSRLAGVAADKALILWNPADGHVTAKAEAPSEIKDVAWTADGKQLITAGADNLVRLWSDALAMTKELKAHTGAVNAVEALAPNRFVTSSADGTVRVWELGKDQPVAQVNHGAPVVAIAVRPDGQRFASASGDNAVKLWAADGKPVAELRGSRYAREFVDASDRTVQLANATVEYRKQAADAAAKQLTAAQDRVKKSGEAIAPKQQDLEAKQKALAEANDAKKAAEQALTAAEADLKKADETLTAADAAAQQAKTAVDTLKAKPAEAPTPAPAAPQAPAAAPANVAQTAPAQAAAAPANPNASPEEIAAAKAAAEKAAADKLAAEKDAAEKAEAERLAAQKATAEKAAAEKAAMDKAVADATTKTQEAAKAKQERDQREAMRKQAADKLDPATKKVTDAQDAMEKAKTARSVADTELELAKGEEQKMSGEFASAKSAIEAAEGEKKKAADALQAAQKQAGEAEQPIRALAFSPDNKTLATAGDDHCVHTWSAETGAPIEVLRGHETAVASLAFAGADALVSATREGAAIEWNLKPEWKLERTLGGESKSPFADRVNALAFSHDGKLLATGGGEPSRGGEIKLWNTADGGLVREFPSVHTDAVFGLDFSPDDKYLASGAADRMARVLDLSTGKVIRSFEGHTHHVLSVAWSLDGRTLITAGADNMVKVWDFTNGERKKNIEGYDKEVTAVRVAAVNGDFLTSSGDNKVRLMALDGREIRTFPEVADFMESAAVTADGKTAVAGGEDGVFRIWNVADGAKIAVFPAEGK